MRSEYDMTTDHDQERLAILFGEVFGDVHGLVKRPTGLEHQGPVSNMTHRVYGFLLDQEEETLRILRENLDRLLGHLRQRDSGLVGFPFTFGCGLVHSAFGEQAEQPRAGGGVE
jgi:hypothetical protein